jgi:hypothetical protein
MSVVDTTLPPLVTNNIPLLNIKVNNTTNLFLKVNNIKVNKISRFK